MKKLLRNLSAALGLFALSLTASQYATAQGELALFNLKGNVKTCKWVNDMTAVYPYFESRDITNQPTLYTFSTKSRLLKIDSRVAVGEGGTALFSYLERDEKGRTSTAAIVNANYSPGGAEIAYTYNTAGQIAEAQYDESVAHIHCTYTYNDKGWESKIKYDYTFGYEDDEEEDLAEYRAQGLIPHTTTVSFTYAADAADAKGNWKKRTAKASDGRTWTETRTITYQAATSTATKRR